ncbi:MAG: periplasmic heavy metal sensor [Deltaproteobacteria bacterium]|nr:periplasmic heavy metal sensor [Deltaproteobacteria bacterium]
MHKRSRFVGMTCLALSLIGGAMAYGWSGAGRGGHHFGRGEGHLEQMVESLGLDEKSMAAVKKILDASKANREDLFAKMHDAHERMRTLLEQEQPEEASVMAQADTIGALETEGRKQRLHTMLAVRALLTPAQRAKLLEKLQEERHGRRGAWQHDKVPQSSPDNPSTQGKPHPDER